MGPQRRVTKHTHEIIEFPFLVYCTTSNSVVCSEQHYVRPSRMEDITVFCTNLTGISRQTIETHGRALQSVVTRIEEVCRGLGSSRVTLCCDGRWDVHFMLQKELRSKAIVVSNPELWSKYYDLKAEFMRMFPVTQFPDAAYHPTPSLRHMARFLGSKIVGNHHCGMDDCETILQIFLHMRARGHRFLDPITIEKDYDPLADVLIKDFNETYEAGSMTLETLCEAFEFAPAEVLAVVDIPFVPQRDVEAVGTFAIIVTDSYRAQVFLSRGNINAFIYSRSHFIARCRENDPTCLSICWRPWWHCPCPELRELGRSLLNLQRLVTAVTEQSGYFQREIKRFLYSGVKDQCLLKARLLFFCLQAGMLLATKWARSEISEAELCMASVHDDQITRIDWSWYDSQSWDAQFGPVIKNSLENLSRLCEEQFRRYSRDVYTSFGTLVDALRSARAASAPLGISWSDNRFLLGPVNNQTDSLFRGLQGVIFSENSSTPLACVGPMEWIPKEVRSFGLVRELELGCLLCTLFWDGAQWSIASQASHDAGEDIMEPLVFPNPLFNAPTVSKGGRSVADAFWSVWKKKGYLLPSSASFRGSMCFCWCLKIGSEDLLLHSCWSVPRLQLVVPIPEECKLQWGWSTVRSFPGEFTSLGDLRRIQEFRHASPLSFCGVEVVDLTSMARMHVQTEQYLALQGAIRFAASKSPNTETRVLSWLLYLLIWVETEPENWLAVCYPQLAEPWNRCSTWFRDACAAMQKAYLAACGGGSSVSKKAFATKVQRSPWKVFLLRMFESKAQNVLQFLRDSSNAEEVCSFMIKQQKTQQQRN